MLIVKNPDEYLSKQKNSLLKKSMQLNLNFYGSPLSISESALKTDFDKLHQLILRKIENSTIK